MNDQKGIARKAS